MVRMKMDIEIVPESFDGGYSIAWYDTLGSTNGKQDRFNYQLKLRLTSFLLSSQINRMNR